MLLDLADLNKRKSQSLFLAELYRDIGDWDKFCKVSNCQNWMLFRSDMKCEHFMNYQRNGCKDRFCPNCQRAYYLKYQSIVSTILNYLLDLRTRTGFNRRYSLVFLTLTVPNAKPNSKSMADTQMELKSSIHNFLYCPELCGWGHDKRGNKRHGRLLGAFVKYEQTVNHRNRTINEHAHVIGIVHNSFYHSRYYLNQKQWHWLWHRACGANYIMNVEAPYYRDKSGKKHHNSKQFIHKISKEMVKYETKSTDFLKIAKPNYNPKLSKNNGTDRNLVKIVPLVRIFANFVKVFKGSRHFISYGLFRKLLHQYRCHYRKFDGYMRTDDTLYGLKNSAKWHNSKKSYKLLSSAMNDTEKLEMRDRGYKTVPLSNSKDSKQSLINYRFRKRIKRNGKRFWDKKVIEHDYFQLSDNSFRIRVFAKIDKLNGRLDANKSALNSFKYKLSVLPTNSSDYNKLLATDGVSPFARSLDGYPTFNYHNALKHRRYYLKQINGLSLANYKINRELSRLSKNKRL